MRALLLAVALTVPAAALADDETDKLRGALRQVTIDLRAAQDSQTELQAQLDEANKQKALLQQQVTALNAKIAATPAAPAAPPPPPPNVIRNLQAQAAAARAQDAGLRAALQKWQGAYQQAAGIAQQKNREAETLSGTSKAQAGQLKTCEMANTRLTGVADDILHLYKTQNFHQILVWSYEPLIGFDQVKLENIVQDYEDKIRDQEYVPR